MAFAGGTASRTLGALSLGAPGQLDPSACACLAIGALSQAAGEAMKLSSFSLEPGSLELKEGDEVAIEVRTDRRTMALAFLSLEARRGAGIVFSARGVFIVQGKPS